MRTTMRNEWTILTLLVWGFIGPLNGCAEAGSPGGLADISVVQPETINQGEPVDWPRWRGVDQNGISPEGGWATDWPADGPAKLWLRMWGSDSVA